MATFQDEILDALKGLETRLEKLFRSNRKSKLIDDFNDRLKALRENSAILEHEISYGKEMLEMKIADLKRLKSDINEMKSRGYDKLFESKNDE